MGKKVNKSGTAPAAAVAMISGEGSACYVLSSPISATLSGTSEATFVRQRTDADEADRSFLLWCLAALVVATVTCGAIAMSALVTILPDMN
jgi:hypothetical protein